MIYERSGKIIFRTGLVQIMEFHACANRTLFLVNQNQVRHPFHQLHGIDNTEFEQVFYFFLNCWCFSRIHQMKLLLNRLGFRISRNFMLDNSWVHAWYLLVRLGKSVTQFLEYLSVSSNLFGGAVRSNENILHNARVLEISIGIVVVILAMLPST
jgi:hypothetical protein